jgi:hypothetical protein
MTGTPEQQGGLSEEFRRLGENLAQNLKAIWEHPQTQELRGEVKEGLVELGETINRLAQDISESPAGHRVQTAVQDLEERIRNGEVESKVRQELIRALTKVNAELERIHQRWSEGASEDEGAAE